MTQWTRRSALAAAALGTISPIVFPVATILAEEPAAPPQLLGALPPHWLDPVIGDGKNPTEIAARFAKSKTFVELVAAAIKEVQDNPPKPGLVGPTYPQRVRLKLLSKLCAGAAPKAEPTK